MSTSGSQIVDQSGNKVKLTGAAWTGAEEGNAVPWGLWHVSHKTILNGAKAMGISCIRWPYCDSAFDMLPPFLSGGTNPDPKFGINQSVNPDLTPGMTTLQIWDIIIAHAGSIGIKIWLDHHWQTEAEGNSRKNPRWYNFGGNDPKDPTNIYNAAKVQANLVMLAQRYAGNSTIIGFEPNNEINTGDVTWGDGNTATDLQLWYETIGNAIHAVNPGALIICQGAQSYADAPAPFGHFAGGDLSFLTNPALRVNLTIPNKVVYAVHSYGPSIATTTPPQQASTWDSSVGFLYQKNIAPIMFGEFGTGSRELSSGQDRPWWDALLAYIGGGIGIPAGSYGPSWNFWFLAANNSPTGSDFGLTQSDWVTPVGVLYNSLAPLLYSATQS